MSLEGSGSTIELHPRKCVCIRYYNFAHGARIFCWMNFSRPLVRQCYASYSMQHIVYDERRYMVDAQMKRGFLEGCVLSTLCRKESYGYQIVKDVPDILGLTESTLYPLLKRLETGGFISVRAVEHN